MSTPPTFHLPTPSSPIIILNSPTTATMQPESTSLDLQQQQQQSPPKSPSFTLPSPRATSPGSPAISHIPKKAAAKDVFSAQILLGMKNFMMQSSSPSCSAPNSPLPGHAPLSPSMAESSELLSMDKSPSSPRDHHPLQTTCTFKECMLCKRGTPFVNNQSPTWACIMRIVFYCLQNEMPQKPFLNLKTDVYGFMTAHWHLLCLDKKRSDNWHKQIQDMLSHSKNLFESGMDTYKQNGYWRMKQISDPWEEIKAKKVLSKRKRSYSEADKDHSFKNAMAAQNAGVSYETSIDKKIQDNFQQLSSQLKSEKLLSLSPASSLPVSTVVATAAVTNAAATHLPPKSPLTPRLKKKLKGETNQTSPSASPSFNRVPPIPTLPILLNNRKETNSAEDEKEDVNIEEIEEIQQYDESTIGLLLLSCDRSSRSSSPMQQSSSLLSSSTESASSTHPSAESLSSVEASNVPHQNGFHHHMSAASLPLSYSAAKDEEIDRLKQHLKEIYVNLSLINQTNDPNSISPMLEKEIGRIASLCRSSTDNNAPNTVNTATNESCSKGLVEPSTGSMTDLLQAKTVIVTSPIFITTVLCRAFAIVKSYVAIVVPILLSSETPVDTIAVAKVATGHGIATVPSELTRNLALIKELDFRTNEVVDRVDNLRAHLISNTSSARKAAAELVSEKSTKQIKNDLKTVLEYADEKVELSNQSYELIDREKEFKCTSRYTKERKGKYYTSTITIGCE
eukprot:gene10850-12639_t